MAPASASASVCPSPPAAPSPPPHHANATAAATATANAPSRAHAPAHAHFFQPPKSPASVAASPSFATATDYFHSASRKRLRPESAHAYSHDIFSTQQTPWAESSSSSSSWTQFVTPSDGIDSSAFGRTSGLVNERYTLAGGFDTPSLESTTRLEQLPVYDNEFRRRLRDDDMDFSVRGGCTPVSGPLARERNGVARLSAAPGEPTQTWTGMAFNLVGKVFSFGGTVIRGFYAGGGKGYEIRSASMIPEHSVQPDTHGTSTPVPGRWREHDEFLGELEHDSPYFAQISPNRPGAKRRQTDRDTWVMVGSPDHDEIPASPRRKASSKSAPRSSLLPQRPGASRASSRRSLAPVSRRQNSFGGDLSLAQHTPLPVQTHSRRASVAQTRSPQGRPISGGLGCMSPEAERYAKRQAKKDRAVDKSMTNMGNRIQEMMRQAHEALGTKYSVEGGGLDMEDEGFVDDGW